MAMTAAEVAAKRDAVLDVPLNRFLGLAFDRAADGVAHAHFDVQAHHLGFGTVNSCVLYALMDTLGLIALLPSLDATEHAVTHDIHVSVMRPVQPGARCALQAAVAKRGRSLAFIDASARVGGVVVATARVTKSIVAHEAGAQDASSPK